jgi:hypothetical protein
MRRIVFFLPMVALGCSMGSTAPDVDSISEENVADSAAALKQGAHFVGTPTCTQSGGNLICSGSIAGLGNRAVTVEVVVTRVCTNHGGNNPPGQGRGQSGPIAPETGRIDFSVLVAGGCPGNQVTTFSSPAEVIVRQGNTIVFSGTISF